MLRPGAAVLAALGVALASPTAPAGSDGRRSPGGAVTIRWIVTGSKMNQLRRIDASLAAHHFDDPRAYAIGNERGRQNQVPDGYAAMPTLKYESYARFRADVAARRVEPAIRVVIYDPESWGDTPPAEQRRPHLYLRRFALLARREGYYVITSPARDLVTVASASCGRRAGEELGAAFIRCGIPGAAARYADAYKVQAQAYERDPAAYRRFVAAAARQARAANADVVLLSNLATSPAGYVATPAMLWEAYASVRDLVAGHQLNVNTPELAVAAEFLRRVRASG